MSTNAGGIPIVVSFGRDGAPVGRTGNLDPEQCDHAGECWSSDLVMRCPRCGARLFAPPRHLARRPRAVLEEMYRLWAAAGWPDLVTRPYSCDRWVVVDHPLFAHIGGLPVRRDKLATFPGM